MTELTQGAFGTAECGCAIGKAEGDLRIEFCALHAAALDMFETLRRVQSLCETILASDEDATLADVILSIVRDVMTRTAKRGP